MNSSENSNNRSRDRPSFRNGGYTWNLYGSERFDVGGVSDKKNNFRFESKGTDASK